MHEKMDYADEGVRLCGGVVDGCGNAVRSCHHHHALALDQRLEVRA